MRITKYEPSNGSMFPYKLRDEEVSTKLDSVHKLGQLEDIEEEIGIYLITLFKALKGQIAVYFKQRDKIYELDGWYLIYSVSTKEFLLKNIDNELNIVLSVKDYGKTWALPFFN